MVSEEEYQLLKFRQRSSFGQSCVLILILIVKTNNLCLKAMMSQYIGIFSILLLINQLINFVIITLLLQHLSCPFSLHSFCSILCFSNIIIFNWPKVEAKTQQPKQKKKIIFPTFQHVYRTIMNQPWIYKHVQSQYKNGQQITILYTQSHIQILDRIVMQNKSQQSTTFEPMMDPNILQCLDKIKQQNEYLKKALETAESLIKNYQQENNRLQIQIKILQCKLKKNTTTAHYDGVECLKSSKTASQRKQKMKDMRVLSQKKEEEKDLQIEELNCKVKKLVAIQQRYEEKITEMEHKIVLLQRNKQDTKVNKQIYALNLGQSYFSTVVRQSEKKTKNLSELRALHMKLKTKEAEEDSSVEKQDKHKIGKGLVDRVFSKQKIGSVGVNSSSKKKMEHKIYQFKRKY